MKTLKWTIDGKFTLDEYQYAEYIIDNWPLDLNLRKEEGTDMAVEFNTFFQALAERLYKENNLSDMTYALCQSDDAFKQFFLDFFFGYNTINVSREKVEISREVFFDEGRPDFTIHVGDDVYLIEVKIWDSNHHFSQYGDILGKCPECVGHLGYIANYEIDVSNLSEDDKKAYDMVCNKGRTVKTWKEFARSLERYQAFNDPVIRGYIDYVRSICPFDDFELKKTNPVATSNFKEIADFINELEIKIEAMDGVFAYNSSRKFCSQERMGHFFELRNYGGDNSVWAWVGASYTQNGAVVSVDFENKDGWGKPVCEQFKNLPFKGDLRFYLKNDSVKYGVFLERVITFVKSKGDSPLPECACLTIDEAAKIKSLLAMKSFPWLMDRFFLPLINEKLVNEADKKWNVSSFDTATKDSEVQNSHCGRYYILQHDGQRYIEFWFGVLFNNTLSTNNGECFSEHPQIIFDISTEDFLHLQSVIVDKSVWYEIKKWKRFVREIASNDSSKFVDIVADVVGVINSIIPQRNCDFCVDK